MPDLEEFLNNPESLSLPPLVGGGEAPLTVGERQAIREVLDKYLTQCVPKCECDAECTAVTLILSILDKEETGYNPYTLARARSNYVLTVKSMGKDGALRAIAACEDAPGYRSQELRELSEAARRIL